MEEECGICLDKIVRRGVLDVCNHLYCFPCIIKWSETANTCPMCQRRFEAITEMEGRKRISIAHIRHTENRRTSLSASMLTTVWHIFSSIFDTVMRSESGTISIDLTQRNSPLQRANGNGVIDLTNDEHDVVDDDDDRMNIVIVDENRRQRDNNNRRRRSRVDTDDESEDNERNNRDQSPPRERRRTSSTTSTRQRSQRSQRRSRRPSSRDEELTTTSTRITKPRSRRNR
eukprot:TRINITY_DN3143_c0_g1_i2.p2 TRINITY_DN3143_c0_g1~~TRINITY_DN3143_c0_g1_i2.p2  ORF type:complete len:230 (+),score=43.10 TRINITY_DN3143_c0_g1_i2:1003-1692(+)